MCLFHKFIDIFSMILKKYNIKYVKQNIKQHRYNAHGPTIVNTYNFIQCQKCNIHNTSTVAFL